jgi:deoxyadenosine/deoxycytidine kinase
VEGNVGAGKSTLIASMKSENFACLVEPLDVWTSVGGMNMLDLQYSSPERWSFTLQSLIVASRWAQLRDVCGDRVIVDRVIVDRVIVDRVIVERSVATDRLFADEAFESGWMTSGEKSAYDMIANACESPSIRGYIWLSTDANDCMRRI